MAEIEVDKTIQDRTAQRCLSTDTSQDLTGFGGEVEKNLILQMFK